tara:strand:- start:466 stop:1242 length:777 start_codon:yes stop_codon:yes gene_type:complete
MGDATVKPSSGDDLVLQNNGGGTKIEIPNSGDIAVTGTLAGSVTVGSGKTLDVSSGTLTLADDQISGDKINGGTIGSGTFNGTVGSSATVSTYTLPAGTIVQAKAGAISNGGGILNFTSSVAEQSTGMSINIIPKFSNSLIYVMASLNAASIGENCGVFWKMENTGLTTRRSFDSQTTYGSSWKTGAMIGVVAGWTDDCTCITHSWQDTAQNATTVHAYTLMANVETTSTGTYLSMNHRGNDANFGSVSYCLALEIKA